MVSRLRRQAPGSRIAGLLDDFNNGLTMGVCDAEDLLSGRIGGRDIHRLPGAGPTETGNL
jgi:hypothetical protein